MRPLEDRFPTLYYDITHEGAADTGAVTEKRVDKENDPSLADVVNAICSSHGLHDTSLTADLGSSLDLFLREGIDELTRRLAQRQTQIQEMQKLLDEAQTELAKTRTATPPPATTSTPSQEGST